MVKPREEFLGSITLLDEDGYGSINANEAEIVGVQAVVCTGKASAPTTGVDKGAFWVQDGSPTQPKFTDSSGQTITIGEIPGLPDVLSVDNTSGAYNIIMNNPQIIKGADSASAGGWLRLYGGDGTGANTTGGTVIVRSGVGTGAAASGEVAIYSLSSSSGSSGSATLNTGSVLGGTNGNSGGITIFTGEISSSSGNSGGFNLYTGDIGGSNSGESGGFTINTGSANSGNSGSISITTGNSDTGDPGQIYLKAGNKASAGSSGQILIESGVGSGGADGGVININAGGGAKGGGVDITAGSGTTTAGIIGLHAGSGIGVNGGVVDISGGNGVIGGDIRLYPGEGPDGYGKVTFENGDYLYNFGNDNLYLHPSTDATISLSSGGGFYVSPVSNTTLTLSSDNFYCSPSSGTSVTLSSSNFYLNVASGGATVTLAPGNLSISVGPPNYPSFTLQENNIYIYNSGEYIQANTSYIRLATRAVDDTFGSDHSPNIELLVGAASESKDGGDIVIQAGDASGTGVGGDIYMSTSAGGVVSITAEHITLDPIDSVDILGDGYVQNDLTVSEKIIIEESEAPAFQDDPTNATYIYTEPTHGLEVLSQNGIRHDLSPTGALQGGAVAMFCVRRQVALFHENNSDLNPFNFDVDMLTLTSPLPATYGGNNFVANITARLQGSTVVNGELGTGLAGVTGGFYHILGKRGTVPNTIFGIESTEISRLGDTSASTIVWTSSSTSTLRCTITPSRTNMFWMLWMDMIITPGAIDTPGA